MMHTMSAARFRATTTAQLTRTIDAAVVQGLAVVHFPSQRKRFVWDRGCI